MAWIMPAQGSTAAGAMTGTGTSAPAPGAAGSDKPPTHALPEWMATLATLLETSVPVKNQAERNTEVTKLCEKMAKDQEDTNTENA